MWTFRSSCVGAPAHLPVLQRQRVLLLEQLAPGEGLHRHDPDAAVGAELEQLSPARDGVPG